MPAMFAMLRRYAMPQRHGVAATLRYLMSLMPAMPPHSHFITFDYADDFVDTLMRRHVFIRAAALRRAAI